MKVPRNMPNPEKSMAKFSMALEGFKNRERTEVEGEGVGEYVQFSGTGDLSTTEILHYMEELLKFIKVYNISREAFIMQGRKTIWMNAERQKIYGELLSRLGRKTIPGHALFAFAVFDQAFLKKNTELNDKITIPMNDIPDIRDVLATKPLSVYEIEPDQTDTSNDMPEFEVDDEPVTMASEIEVDIHAIPAVEAKHPDRWEKYFVKMPAFFVGAISAVQDIIDTVCIDATLKCPECGAMHVNLLMLRDNTYGALYGCAQCGSISYDTEDPSPTLRLKQISHFNLWIKLVLGNSTY